MDARPPGVSRALGNGHCVAENLAVNGRPIARWHPLYGEEVQGANGSRPASGWWTNTGSAAPTG